MCDLKVARDSIMELIKIFHCDCKSGSMFSGRRQEEQAGGSQVSRDVTMPLLSSLAVNP